MLKLRWAVLALALNPLIPGELHEMITSWLTPPAAMADQARRVPGTAGCGMDPNGIQCEDGRAPASIPDL